MVVRYTTTILKDNGVTVEFNLFISNVLAGKLTMRNDEYRNFMQKLGLWKR